MAVQPQATAGPEPSTFSEVTPLLKGSNEEIQQKSNDEESDDTPLPFRQIALLCYCRMVEPVAYFSIFPYINQMIRETGVEEADVGFYSGWVESLFSLTQMCLMIAWGKAADKYGRKLILVISLRYSSMYLPIWTQIHHHSPSNDIRKQHAKDAGQRFSYFAFTAFLATLLGPFLGGILCNPADLYPEVFGQTQFFVDYPYALPNFATGLFGASAAILTVLFIEETLNKKSGGEPSVISEDTKMSTWELLKFPGVSMVLYIYSHTSNTLLIFPPLQHRFGTKGVLRMCTIILPCVFVVWPLCNLLIQNDWMLAFWIIAPLNTIVGGSFSISFTSVQLAINDISPSHHTLGLISAVSLVLTSLVRAFSPVFFTTVYAIGVSSQVFGGYLIWFVLVAFALILAGAVLYLPKRAEGIIKHDENDG